MRARLFWLCGAWVVAVMACDTGAPPPDPPAPMPETPGAIYTLDQMCDRLAPALCAAREDCCRLVGFPYDDVACEARERQNCRQIQEAVEDGASSFDGAHLDACIAEVSRMIERCVLSYVDLVYETYDVSRICGRTFVGERGVGEPCSRDAECKTTDEAVVVCDEDQGRCVARTVREEGEPCDPETEFCRPGFFCDVDLTQMPLEGVCVRAAWTGDACDPDAVVSACGPDRFCDAELSQCVDTLPGEAACERASQCQSFSCVDEVCAFPLATVSEPECTGG